MSSTTLLADPAAVNLEYVCPSAYSVMLVVKTGPTEQLMPELPQDIFAHPQSLHTLCRRSAQARHSDPAGTAYAPLPLH